MALSTLHKLPFAQNLVFNCAQFFSKFSLSFFKIHKVIDGSKTLPPGLRTFNTIHQDRLVKILLEINRQRRFISFKEALALLYGQRPFENNFSVLIVNNPYMESLERVFDVACRHHIPLTIGLSHNAVMTGTMPWYDEIAYWFLHTKQSQIKMPFLDRPLFLNTPDRMLNAYHYLIDTLANCDGNTLILRLNYLKNALEVYSRPTNEYLLARGEYLKKISLHPLVSFAYHGTFQWPLLSMNEEAIHDEIGQSLTNLEKELSLPFLPLFLAPKDFHKKPSNRIMKIFQHANIKAILTEREGFAFRDDNVFTLPSISLTNTLTLDHLLNRNLESFFIRN